jgi:hypothetical protein
LFGVRPGVARDLAERANLWHDRAGTLLGTLTQFDPGERYRFRESMKAKE